MLSSTSHIDASTISTILVSPLSPSFLEAYNLSDVRPCASSLTFLSSGSFVQVRLWSNLGMGPNILQRTAQMSIPLRRFLLQNLVSRSFLVRMRYSFVICSFIAACLIISASNIPKYL